MRRGIITVLILLFLFYFTGCFTGAWASQIYSPYGQPVVSADAAVLMDINTGQVLYAKNPFKRRPPASTTKIMTGLLALEYGDLKTPVIVSKRAARTGGSSMYLQAGQTLPMSDLLYGALLSSGNDACEAIAEHIAGGIESFARIMNMRALAIGAMDTHFVNPHGLPDDEHYITAYDLALIGREAFRNRVFADIVSTKTKNVDFPGDNNDRRLKNTNRLLWKYQWAEGVKTGTTGAAGPCLVSAAVKDNRQLLAVVLYSGNRWDDSIEMFEYGFNRFEYQQVAVSAAEFGSYRVLNGNRDVVPVAYSGDLGILVPRDDPKALETRVTLNSYLTAPIAKGQILGSVSYLVNNSVAGTVDLVSPVEVKPEGVWARLGRWIKTKVHNILGQIPTKFCVN